MTYTQTRQTLRELDDDWRQRAFEKCSLADEDLLKHRRHRLSTKYVIFRKRDDRPP